MLPAGPAALAVPELCPPASVTASAISASTTALRFMAPPIVDLDRIMPTTLAESLRNSFTIAVEACDVDHISGIISATLPDTMTAPRVAVLPSSAEIERAVISAGGVLASAADAVAIDWMDPRDHEG